MSEVVQEPAASPADLLASGRRHLAVRDYSSAASVLADACEALAKEHGEAADQCAEAYLWYGKALLGLSREESGVLGDGVPGANNDGEGEGDDEDQEENGEAEAAENGKPEEKIGETEKNDEAENNEAESTIEVDSNEAESTIEAESGIDESMSEEAATTNGESAKAGPSRPAAGDAADDDPDDTQNNEDDVDNLQLAWEMLDLARSIFSKRAGAGAGAGGARAALADVHLALGEVALESETYDKAVVDMMSCLELQKELYRSDDRRIAETHYQIGLANSLASNFDDAITHFKNAANILETRIKTLENPTTAAEDTDVQKHTANDPQYSAAGEVRELRALLPEIQEKIQDMLEYKAETIKQVREQLGLSNGDGGASSSSAFNSSNGTGATTSSSSEAKAKPAADITHLIKRKRRSSENEPEGSAPKKTNI